MAVKTPVHAKFWPHFEKQNGCHSLLFENHKSALNLEILQLAKSNMHENCMARKASLITLALLKNGCHIACLMSNGVIQLKRPYISLILLLEV